MALIRKIILIILVGGLLLPVSAWGKPRTIRVEWGYQYDGSIAGYRLYHGNSIVCETNDPNANSMFCDVNLPDGKTYFTITAIFENGSESLHSEPFAYIFSSKLIAGVSAQPLSGITPLSVLFDASSSRGNIISFDWSFGDGTIGIGKTTSHVFTEAGSYTTTLKTTDDIGAVDRETVTISITSPPGANTPPTAVISSSATVGDAPLPVDFDGSMSTDKNGSIIVYKWAFGDGGTGTGQLISYTYYLPGNFASALTVTDDGGLSDSASTPVLISEPAGGPLNSPPTAAINTSVNWGHVPLAVSFSGLESTDPDNEIIDYFWNFGDGLTGNGSVVDHLYTRAGTYKAKLKVTDSAGAFDEALHTITVQPSSAVTFEVGTVSIGDSWVRVDFTGEYADPVLVAGPPGYNDFDPAVVRIRNVDNTGFDISIQEWDYLDGPHGIETVHYIVMEQGSYTMENGTRLEAGTFTANDRFGSQIFSTGFTVDPVVFTSVVTTNEGEAVTGRIRKLSTDGFDYKLSEQESSRSGHADETVAYVAWEPGSGVVGPYAYTVGRTADSVTEQWERIVFNQQFYGTPSFFANIQSYNSGENAAIRYQYLTPEDVFIYIEEETSKDTETAHTAETVGYMAIRSLANGTY